MASLSGKRVKSQRSGLYAFSKFAAVGLAHALRHEGWDHGIRATAICPGIVATDMGLSAANGSLPVEAMTQVGDLAALTLNTIETPGTLCQAEITFNCQLDGIF
jgi:NAD(P)-dependent dehydrogenase (short-subunit alcohol dehydrogenase family)